MARKLNFSSKRILIYNALKNTKAHPSPGMVYEQLKPEHPDLSLGTVYRNINLFKEQGLLNTVAVVNGEERVDANVSPHAHFVCKCCGGVYDIFDEKLTALKTGLEENGFETDYCNVIFHGTCNKCS